MSFFESLLNYFKGENRWSPPSQDTGIEDLLELDIDPFSPPPPLQERDKVPGPYENADEIISTYGMGEKPESGLLDHSEEVANFVANYEQFRPKAYKDDAGVWTVGYGMTKGIGPQSKMSKAQAKKAMAVHLKDTADDVRRLVKVPLTQNEFDALVSLVYNVGEGAFAKSRALKALNQGDRETFVKEAFDPIRGFVKAGGKINEGLQRRREDEKNMFLNNRTAYNRTYKTFTDIA